MIILKELVEWRLTTECLPTAESLCIGRGPGDRHGECFYNAETRMWCWMNSPYVEDEAPPEWWAYMPKGPSKRIRFASDADVKASAAEMTKRFHKAFQLLAESGD